MNKIEKNKISDIDRAINYLIPAAVPSFMANQFKTFFKNNIPEKVLINKANTKYFKDNASVYIDFFLTYLKDCKEVDSFIVTVLNDKIFLARISIENGIELDNLSQILIEDSVYLGLKNVKDGRFKTLLTHWNLSESFIVNDEEFYIQLFPALTCRHLHELYKIICTYL